MDSGREWGSLVERWGRRKGGIRNKYQLKCDLRIFCLLAEMTEVIVHLDLSRPEKSFVHESQKGIFLTTLLSMVGQSDQLHMYLSRRHPLDGNWWRRGFTQGEKQRNNTARKKKISRNTQDSYATFNSHSRGRFLGVVLMLVGTLLHWTTKCIFHISLNRGPGLCFLQPGFAPAGLY